MSNQRTLKYEYLPLGRLFHWSYAAAMATHERPRQRGRRQRNSANATYTHGGSDTEVTHAGTLRDDEAPEHVLGRLHSVANHVTVGMRDIAQHLEHAFDLFSLSNFAQSHRSSFKEQSVKESTYTVSRFGELELCHTHLGQHILSWTEPIQGVVLGVECSIAPASLNLQQFPQLQLDEKKDKAKLEGLELELFISLLEETLRVEDLYSLWEQATFYCTQYGTAYSGAPLLLVDWLAAAG